MPTTKKHWVKEEAAKKTEKLTKYRELAFETRERRPGYEIYVAPVIVNALGSGVKEEDFR